MVSKPIITKAIVAISFHMNKIFFFAADKELANPALSKQLISESIYHFVLLPLLVWIKKLCTLADVSASAQTNPTNNDPKADKVKPDNNLSTLISRIATIISPLLCGPKGNRFSRNACEMELFFFLKKFKHEAPSRFNLSHSKAMSRFLYLLIESCQIE